MDEVVRFLCIKPPPQNSSLRRKQIAVAMAGNVTMLIWLGKQYLDQTDRRETQISMYSEEIARRSDEELQGLIDGNLVVLPRYRR